MTTTTSRDWSEIADAQVGAIQRDYGVPDDRMRQLIRAIIIAERSPKETL